MSGDLSHLASCLDLRDADVAEAVDSRDATKGLLAHLAERSRPNTGAAKVLLVFARMATSACDWIDGDLLVELVGDEDLTVIEALTELGGGLRERLLAPTTFQAPLAEFARAIERVPHLIAPLAVRAKSGRRISLSVAAAIRQTTVPPPPIDISADSLFVRAPALLSPRGAVDELPLPVVRSVVPSAATPERSEPPASPPVVDPINEVDGGWDE
jgi:hypothetical protein